MNNKINYDNLRYVVESIGHEYKFNKTEDSIALLNDIKKGRISLEEAKEKQKNYYNYLNTIRRGNKMLAKKEP